ncbi:MAG: NERD domain-containing protein [Gammaproteobacteria bacterium]|nr:MAG: NERD domain-containing protein [Gammaproteobacteria bacterium]
MDYETLLNQLNLQSELVAMVIVVLALALIVFVNRKRIQMRWGEWRTQRCLKRIGSEQIRDLVCADGLDGFYRIDRLALTPHAILLISYKPYGGNIYCAERISEWTQVIGKKSYKFENPLFELDNQLAALRLLIGSAPLEGYLFFNRSALFPKGHPDSVLNPDNIPQQFISKNREPPKPEIQAAWDILKSQKSNASTAGQIGVKT